MKRQSFFILDRKGDTFLVEGRSARRALGHLAHPELHYRDVMAIVRTDLIQPSPVGSIERGIYGLPKLTQKTTKGARLAFIGRPAAPAATKL